MSADLKGSYIWYNDNGLDNLNKPDLDLRAKARLDITKQTKAEIDGRFGLHADNPGDPNLPADIATPPMYITPGAHGRNQAYFQSPGIVAQGLDRSHRLSAMPTPMTAASSISRDRNYNQYGARVRAAYESLPGIKPFVEYGVDLRRHDRENDAAGIARNSDGRPSRSVRNSSSPVSLSAKRRSAFSSANMPTRAFPTIRGIR